MTCSGSNPLCYQHAHPAGDGHGHDDPNLPPLLLQRGGQVQAQQRGAEDVITAGAHRIPHGEAVFLPRLLGRGWDMALGQVLRTFSL